jgi:colicin import membrane protein
MSEQPKRHPGTVIMSVALHVAVVAALSVGVRFTSPPPAMNAAPAPIQGVMIDQAAVEKEQQRRDQAARAETQRKQREERQARERVEQQRRDKEAAAQRERERVVEQQRKEQAEKERVAREAKEAKERDEAAKREQERVAQEKAAAEKRAKDEAARKQREAAEARARAQAEADLQRQLAAEAEAAAAAAAGLQDQYIRMIADKIERNWVPPLSAKPGLECLVNVVQIPSGDVVDVRVGRCNGDEAVVRSIEAAVRRASPLPPPPSQAVFNRNLNVTFKPQM